MDSEIQQFVRVNCYRLSVPRLNHLINLINEWSRASLHYDSGVIENRVYYWVPGSVGVEVAGGSCGDGDEGGFGAGAGAGGFGGNNQQGLGGNDHQAVQGEAVEVSGSKEGEAAVAVDEDHEAGYDHQSKRKRMREHQREKKKKIQKV